MKKILTVFTPTYNRGYCLNQLYESLVKQTSKNFEWLIIDDGSTDNTKRLVAKWKKEGKIYIKYVYKDNGGMHTAHNVAYNHITTKLNVCVDSDDFLVDDAVATIEKCWSTIENQEKCAGIMLLNIDKAKEIIGTKFPKSQFYSTIEEIYYHHKVRGDKKIVLRTDVVGSFSLYPEFKEERFVPLGTLYLRICKEFNLYCVNIPVCVVEYLSDGSSLNMLQQYYNNPKGFRYARAIEIQNINRRDIIFKKAVHSISSTLLIGDYRFKYAINSNIILSLAFLPGIILYLYIKIKLRR